MKCNFQCFGGLSSSAPSPPPHPHSYLCQSSSPALAEGPKLLTREVAPKRHAPFLSHLARLNAAPADGTHLPALFGGHSLSLGVWRSLAAGGCKSKCGKSSCGGHGKAAGQQHSFLWGQLRGMPLSCHGTLENAWSPTAAPHLCLTRFSFSSPTWYFATADPFPGAHAAPG